MYNILIDALFTLKARLFLSYQYDNNKKKRTERITSNCKPFSRCDFFFFT